MAQEEAKRASILPGAAVFAAVTAYVIAILLADKQNTILILFGVGVAAVLLASLFKLLKPIGRSFSSHETAFNVLAILAMLLIAGVFREEHFVLLLVVTFMLYAVAALGLTIQFGYAGVVNFAGASFFGIGAYTSAVLTTHTALPHLAILFLGGVTAALAGIVLLPPILRTSGHYAAVVTIAFALLFKSFIEVNDVLGGPQGYPPSLPRSSRMVLQRQHYRSRLGNLLLYELLPAQPRPADLRLRVRPEARTLVDRAKSRCDPARRDRGKLLRAGHCPLEGDRVSSRQFPDRARRSA